MRRTLAGAVIRHDTPGARELDPDEGDGVHDRVARLAGELHADLLGAADQIELHGELADVEVLLERLALATTWHAARYRGESRRYAGAYPEGVEILPPDRYGDVVVMPALGCPNGRCSFCAFYRGRAFRPVSDERFAQHLGDVRALLGPTVHLRKGVFLGSASAASLSQRVLLRRLEQIATSIGPRPRGVATFWDPDHSPTRSADDWRALAAAGLRAVYVGLETGLPSLRSALGKSGDVAALLRRVEVQRSADVSTGVIVLADVGDDPDRHRAATAEAIAAMQLGRRDIVFVSPLRQGGPAPHWTGEAERLRAELRAHTGARVAPYCMDGFHDYA